MRSLYMNAALRWPLLRFALRPCFQQRNCHVRLSLNGWISNRHGIIERDTSLASSERFAFGIEGRDKEGQ